METKLVLPSLQLFKRLVSHGQRTAIVSSETGCSLTYETLLREAGRVSRQLGKQTTPAEQASSATSSSFRPIALLAPRNHHYCVGKLAILQVGGAVVPLYTRNPPAEMEYILRDANCQQIVLHPQFRPALAPLLRSGCLPLEVVELPVEDRPPQPDFLKTEMVGVEWFDLPTSTDAMVVYTSGTTGRPKGVVKTHAQLEEMAQSVVDAWMYSCNDRVLHLLPLHHLHGILNKLLAVLWAGGTVEFLEQVNARAIWQRLGASEKPALTMFHAVPTIYASMLEALEARQLSEETKREALQHIRSLRLMVSGSAALPETCFKQWETLTGHRLLERYGTTEAGMMLGNPLHPMHARYPGYVGQPFSGIEIRLIDPDTDNDVSNIPGQQGEVRVRTKQGVFSRYHNRPDATREAFDDQGFYKSGDLAEWDAAKQSYKILGRMSSDILKSGGFKISALEIEAAIQEHTAVREVSVVGRPHPKWGEEIVAVVRLKNKGMSMTLEALRTILANHLASYKLPRALYVLEDGIPRNALGKVNKKTLLAEMGIEKSSTPAPPAPNS